MYNNDQRIVFTLDAGGTNFVFNAIQGNKKLLTQDIAIEAHADNLDQCLGALASGFRNLEKLIASKPVALSFGFPGPADYPNGIIDRTNNLPCFLDGVALGDFLQDEFHLPIFINNDADLFAYGEALAGSLPHINQRLREMNSAKQFQHLIGFTLGTGFGMGVVAEGHLYRGDNSCVEVYCLPHKVLDTATQNVVVEEGVSIRAIRRLYGQISGNISHNFTPLDIFNIAEGTTSGDRVAAQKSFAIFGEVAGSMMAYSACMLDGIIVLGGGLTGAHKYFMPALLKELRADLYKLDGTPISKVPSYIFDLDDEAQWIPFAQGQRKEIAVYGSKRKVVYDPQKRLGIIRSKIGTSDAVALGAYSYALSHI